MPRSFDRIVIHTVFGTKYRDPWIDEVIEPELHSVLAGTLIDQGCKVIEIGGTVDHVHILHTLPRTKSIASVIGTAKRQSSAWLSEFDSAIYALFAWQEGYGAFSVDWRRVEVTDRYIQNQKAHHGSNNNRMTFRQEFEIFVEKYEVDGYDPKYIFPDPPTDHQSPVSFVLDRAVPLHKDQPVNYTYPTSTLDVLFTSDPAPLQYRSRRPRQRRRATHPRRGC